MSGISYNGKRICRFSRILFCLGLLFALIASGKGHGKTRCKGPIRFYEELNCQAKYADKKDNCASRYDCSYLDKQLPNSCYINGHKYNIGEKLRKEDKTSPCDIDCTCLEGHNGIAHFTCATVDCFNTQPAKEGCYLKKKKNSCCETEEICPGASVPQCVVDGNTYYEGQEFYPIKNPELECTCMEGYSGENVAPFCRKLTCGIELRHGMDIRSNCVPVFESSLKPQNSCAYQYRCQDSHDTVISKQRSPKPNVPDNKKCKFGNLLMHVGDELKQGTDYSSSCMKCVCEVPPLPTCQKIPYEECDANQPEKD